MKRHLQRDLVNPNIERDKKLFQKVNSEVTGWVGCFLRRYKTDPFSEKVSPAIRLNMFFGYLGKELYDQKIGLIVFDVPDVKLEDDFQSLRGGRFYVPGKRFTKVESQKPDKTGNIVKVKFPGLFGTLEGTGFNVNLDAVLSKQRLTGEHVLEEVSDIKRRYSIKGLLERGKKHRGSYYDNVDALRKSHGLKLNSSLERLFTRIVERFNTQGSPLMTCIPAHSLALDKYQTYLKLKDEFDRVKGLYLPQTISSRDVNEEWINRLIFQSLYLFDNPEYHIVAKDRFGSQGKGINFVVRKTEKGTIEGILIEDNPIELHFDDMGKFIDYLKNNPNLVIQSFTPAKFGKSTYDIRVIWVGPHTPPTFYLRKNEGSVVSNISQGGEGIGDLGGLTQPTLKYSDRIYKIIRKKLKDEDIRFQTEYGLQFEEPIFSDMDSLATMMGLDIAFTNTRSKKPTRKTFYPFLTYGHIDKLLAENPTQKLEELRKIGKDGRLCLFFEVNSNPGMTIPTTYTYISKQDGEKRYLVQDIAHSLAEEIKWIIKKK